MKQVIKQVQVIETVDMRNLDPSKIYAYAAEFNNIYILSRISKYSLYSWVNITKVTNSNEIISSDYEDLFNERFKRLESLHSNTTPIYEFESFKEFLNWCVDVEKYGVKNKKINYDR